MEEKEIHLRDYLRVIQKRRYPALVFLVVVVSLFIIWTFTVTSEYRASTKLYIEKVEPSSLIKDIRFLAYDPDFYGTQYQLIKSKRVARSVVKMLAPDRTFRAYFEGGSRGGALWLSPIGWLSELYRITLRTMGVKTTKDKDRELPDSLWEDRIANAISRDIMVRPVKDSKIVDISYMSENPEVAKLVANTVAKAYIGATLEMKMSASKNTLQWMTKKAEEEMSRLEKSERALQEYMQANNIVTLEDRLTIIPEKLSELSTKLTKAETKREELETLYAKVRTLPRNLKGAESLSFISNDPTVRSIREQILVSEKNVLELSKKYGKKHPLMIKAKGDLNILDKKRRQEIRRVIASIKNEYELAQSNEEKLRKLLADTKQEALNLSEKFIQYGVLKREVETNRQLYDSLITKMKEQSLTEEIHSVNVWIVEEAEMPKSPNKPRKVLNIMVGLMLGLFGGIGLAFFIDYLDNTVKSPEEAESRLGVPVLGMVSFFGKGDKDSEDKNIEKIVIQEPKSTFAESYKALRTGLMLSSADSPPKSVLVTSSGPGEGKTTTSVNLALAVAQSDRRVLLMDADLRKPSIHRIFEKSNRVGLSTFLAGDASKFIYKGPLPNMDIITAGPVPPNPSELLGARRFQTLMSELRAKYDLIVCDSPPALTVTDSLILSKQFDGTIIVVRAGKTSYEFVGKGLKMLNDIRANVLGLLLNAMRVTKSDYYYKYYSYYYAYGEEECDKGPQ